MMLVTVTLEPPSWRAIEPQKFSAATIRSGAPAELSAAGTAAAQPAVSTPPATAKPSAQVRVTTPS